MSLQTVHLLTRFLKTINSNYIIHDDMHAHIHNEQSSARDWLFNVFNMQMLC